MVDIRKQDKLGEDEKDEFVESLKLTPEKIKADMGTMKCVEGFPIGEDDDLLGISNPPYYTAYPNPYIKDFIEKYGKTYAEETDDYHREPFIENESHGRTDSVYNIHFYHTKVPPQAILKYVNHYTNEGDIVLDFFCGSGMTGVAGLRINRHSILSDLSPFATFISNGNNSKIDRHKFEHFAERVYLDVYNKTSWVYDVVFNNQIYQATFFIWSSMIICPFCNNKVKYVDLSITDDKSFCPVCKSEIKPKSDDFCEEGFVPSKACFNMGNKRIEIELSKKEIDIIKQIDAMSIPYWFPSQNYMFKEGKWGDTWRAGVHKNFHYVNDFFTKRNIYVLSCAFEKISQYDIEKQYKLKLMHTLTAAMSRLTKLNRYMPQHDRHVGPLSGTMYIPKISAEINVLNNWHEKIDACNSADYDFSKSRSFISTQSATDLRNLPNNSIDYIFVDPPFGDNLLYSELNFLFESWLKTFTNNVEEAIVSADQNKSEYEYKELMKKSFKEAFRVLKPKRWITIEFHNSKASIWKCIQEALVSSGFIIGQVVVLDKQKGTIKQLTCPGAVKNDLVINAYKPSTKFTESFLKKAGLNMEQDFVDMHLDKLPVEPNIERTPQMLYSKMLAQYIQNGFEVRMDALEFYDLLRNHFVERDGFWFKSGQVAEYEKRLKLSKTINKRDLSQTILGIEDEKSAIIWLAQFLSEPKTYSDISIEFNQKLMTSEDQIPELKTILEENFVTEGGKYRIPSVQEKKEKADAREKRLSKEFERIMEEVNGTKKIKVVRKEALLHGLMKLYKDKNVDLIKKLGAKLDRRIIDSDEDVSAIIDWATYRGE